MKRLFLFLFLCCIQFIQAQKVTKTSQKASDVISLLSNNQEWTVPISVDKSPLLKWKERESSFSNEGLRLYVGYNNDNFVATISVSSNRLSGSLLWNDNNFVINTSDDGFITIQEEKTTDEHCGVVGDFAKKQNEKMRKFEKKLRVDGYIPPDVITSDGILRVYRLALTISSVYYNGKFHSNIDEVKKFWAETEVWLNELYTRDIGVKFKVINDERLIFKTASEDPFSHKSANAIVQNATFEINDLIGVENYDVGLAVTTSASGGLNGLAGLASAYETYNKGYAMAAANYSTIAHEVGHLFGTNHTFSVGGSNTYYTETGRGQSVMSYGLSLPRDFFSMVSILKIWRILSKVPYYSDEQRTHLVRGGGDIDNIPYGIDTHNTAPIINTKKLHDTYTIPKETFFQFYIPAVDKEQKDLYYYAHQSDVKFFAPSNAKFLTFKPQYKNNNIAFQTTYGEGNFALEPDSTPTGTGEFTFWLGVSDYNPKDENHASMHDMYITKVKIVDGKPFKITSNIKRKYTAGEKVTLTWDVDEEIFKDTKVRILMSDDFGKTFKYVLASGVDNNGSCEVTIPNIKLGRINHWRDIFVTGAGLFKIEVMDHIAHAISNNNPTQESSGFEIENTGIIFENLPENEIYVSEFSDTPEKANVTATSACSSSTDVTLNYTETIESDLITRTWTATDECNNTATFVQKIHITNVSPLKFNETLPENLDLSCTDEIPEKAELTASGGCGNPTVTYLDVKIEGYCKYTWKRTWTATSDCADPISYTQYISVSNNKKPEFNKLPEDMVIEDESQLPYKEYLSASGGCTQVYMNNTIDDEKVYDEKGNLTKIIRTWKAVDDCKNEAVHTQTFTIKNSLAVSDLDNDTSAVLYPNPVKDIFTLKGIDSVQRVEVIDLSGKVVKTFKIQQNYNISELNNGIYVVRVLLNNQTSKTFKVIKK